MDEHKYADNHPWDDRVYGTGRTQPRKSHGGLIAFLLILIILLSGIIGILGAMNIRLFSQLQAQESQKNAITFTDQGNTASFFAEPDDIEAACDPKSSQLPDLGIEGESVSAFYQNYYRMPPGLYITRIDENSDAALQGITYGDILTHIDENPITDMESLNTLLAGYQPGDTVQVRIYRGGKQHSFRLVLRESHG